MHMLHDHLGYTKNTVNKCKSTTDFPKIEKKIYREFTVSLKLCSKKHCSDERFLLQSRP